MKTLLLFFVLFCVTFSSHAQPKEFSWLQGVWKLTDKNAYEVWSLNADNKTLHGISFRIKQAGDTVITEDIVLQQQGDSYFYIPDVAGDQPAVPFKITSYDVHGFVAENANHDFPKIIRYKNVKEEGQDRIKATVEGNGRSILFTFVRVK